MSALLLLVGCGRTGTDRAAADEITTLSHETFAQAAEPGRCKSVDCDRQELGFAYAKKNKMVRPDDCEMALAGKADEDFVEGCRQYGEDIESAERHSETNP